jgi:hypothetical protein
MGLIEIVNDLTTNNKYRCNDKKSNFIMFATLLYSNDVKFSNKVTNNIWLGNFVDSSNETFILGNNIKVIVNCSKDLPFYFNTQEVPYQYRIPVDDDRRENSFYIMYIYLPKIVEIIRFHVNRGENVYIHCHAGMQRSACVMAAYLMRETGMSPSEIIPYIVRVRPICFKPYVNFQKSLDNYYTLIKNKEQ